MVPEPRTEPGRGELAAHGKEAAEEQNQSREGEASSTFSGHGGRSPATRSRVRSEAKLSPSQPPGGGDRLLLLGFCPEATLMTWKMRNEGVCHGSFDKGRTQAQGPVPAQRPSAPPSPGLSREPAVEARFPMRDSPAAFVNSAVGVDKSIFSLIFFA